MGIYYFIFFAGVISLLFYFVKKIIYVIKMNLKLQQIQFGNKKNENKIEDDDKPEKFNSILKQKQSRLDKIIECKNL